MSEFTFKVNLVAVVRVRAADESVAAPSRFYNPWSTRHR